MNIFPFTVYPSDNGHYVAHPPGFIEEVVNRAKKLGRTWYTYSVQVNSMDKAVVYVHGMQDNVYGGINPISEWFLVSENKSAIQALVEQKVKHDVKEEREKELRDAEELELFNRFRATMLVHFGINVED